MFRFDFRHRYRYRYRTRSRSRTRTRYTAPIRAPANPKTLCISAFAPVADTTGKPADRAWYEPDGTLPDKAFFKLEAELK